MSGLTIKKDDVVTHGAYPNRIIDILMSGSLLSNIEMEKAGYENARTFNFERDVTYGQKKSTVEAHNVCLELNKFYGLAGKDKAYIMMPAHVLADRGYQFMDQDGFHVLPPGYKGHRDEDGTNISLRDIPFRIVANKETAQVLASAMKASGLYDQQKIDETFIINENIADISHSRTKGYEEERVRWLESSEDSPPPVVRYDADLVLDEAKQSMGLGMKNAPDIELTRHENSPSVLTRAFPNGDPAKIYRKENADRDYTPTSAVMDNKWKLEVAETHENGRPKSFKIPGGHTLVHAPDENDFYRFKLQDKDGKNLFDLRMYDPERHKIGERGWQDSTERWKWETSGRTTFDESIACSMLFTRAVRRGIFDAYAPPPPPSSRPRGVEPEDNLGTTFSDAHDAKPNSQPSTGASPSSPSGQRYDM